MLMCVILIATILVTISATPAEPTSVASSETQFKIDVAYAYVGETPANASYMARNGTLMSPIIVD
jgi:hypothetical protein